jgi:L-arabinose isomerase
MPKIGLLPLYLKLYDDCMPDERAKFDDFLKRIAVGFEQRGVAVKMAPVCRIASEF